MILNKIIIQSRKTLLHSTNIIEVANHALLLSKTLLHSTNIIELANHALLLSKTLLHSTNIIELAKCHKFL